MRGDGGSRANLSDTDLRGANLSDTDLRGANLSDTNLRDTNLSDTNLSDTNLRGADLQQSQGVLFSQVSWSGHGECGRQLLAVYDGGAIKLFCGCFSGTESDLREYIESGSDDLMPSRTKALDFVMSCFE